MWLVLSVDLDFFCSSDTWIKRQNNGVAKTFNNKNQSWWISRFTVELKTSLRWWVFLVLECITDNTQGFWCIFCEYFWVHSEREDKDRIIEGGQINDCLKPRWFWDTAVGADEEKASSKSKI